MNSSEIVQQRLHNQRLTSSEFKKPVEVVKWLGAVQAQDFHGAKWAIAQRMRDTTNTVVEEAYNKGRIVRTHIMRPTRHFVAPDDIRWLLELTAPRVNIGCGSNYRKLELDERILRKCNKALARALHATQHLTRAALRESLDGRVHWSTLSRLPAGRSLQLANLLPAFDEYLVAYRDRKAVFEGPDGKMLNTVNGIFAPTIIIDGKLAGSWKPAKDNRSVMIDLNPFRPLNSPERLAVVKAASRYASFLGLTATIM